MSIELKVGTRVRHVVPIARLLAATCIGLSAFTAAAAQSASPSEGVALAKDSATISSPVELRIESPDRVVHGEPVRVTLILANRTDSTVALTYGGPGAPDVWVGVRARANSPPLWYSDHLLRHTLMAISGSLPPRGTRVFTVTWPQTDLAGASVSPGTYFVSGVAAAYVYNRYESLTSETKVVVITPH